MEEDEGEYSSGTNKLDLVFCADATGSMGSYLNAVQENIQRIVEYITTVAKCDVRFGLVQYRDHPPEDNSFISKKYEFTTDPAQMKTNVDSMFASGGGDGPEALADGLRDALGMAWRPEAAKVVVLVTDAPPHGVEPNHSDFISDGFPGGCPCGSDPLLVARAMSRAGIVVYTIGAEPGLSTYVMARDLLRAVAKITSGQFLPLSSAGLLAQTIVGIAMEEIELTSLMSQIKLEAQDIASATYAAGMVPTQGQVLDQVAGRLQTKAVQTTKVVVGDLYQGSLPPLDPRWMTATSVNQVRDLLGPLTKKLSTSGAAVAAATAATTSYYPSTSSSSSSHVPTPFPKTPPTGDTMEEEEDLIEAAHLSTAPTSSAAASSGPQTAGIVHDTISVDQVCRAFEKALNMGIL